MTHAQATGPEIRDVPTQLVAGVTLAALDLPTTAEVMADMVGGPVGHAVFTCNVDHVMLQRHRSDFAQAYRDASLVTADGSPLVALARVLGGPVRRRVTGADLVPALAAVATRRRLRMTLVGGAPGVAERAADVLRDANTGLDVVTLPPPAFGFSVGDTDDHRLVAALRKAGPSLVIVCFGAPKQELWIAAHRAQLPGSVLLGAGASLDFLVGVQRRAPLIYQRIGLEFLWRLLVDWPRLWRRYLLRDTGFVFVAASELWRARRSTHRRSRGRLLAFPSQRASSQSSAGEL